MPEFKRTTVSKQSEDGATRNTIILGLLSLSLVIVVVFFGLPFLVKLSVFLGDIKNKRSDGAVEKILPPLPPRLIVPFEATSSAKILISGVSEAGVEVELLKNEVSLMTTKSGADGSFTFENVDLSSGVNMFSAIARVEGGGGSDVSKPIEITYDNQPPEISMSNPSEGSLSVDYSEFDVIGKSEKNVSVLVGGHVAMVDDDGNFKSRVQLAPGKNDIEIVARDTAGNETRKKIEIKYDI